MQSTCPNPNLVKSEFSKGFALAWQLFCRDFKAQYRQSLLGYVWAFVPVLATTLTWVFVSSPEPCERRGNGNPLPRACSYRLNALESIQQVHARQYARIPVRMRRIR